MVENIYNLSYMEDMGRRFDCNPWPLRAKSTYLKNNYSKKCWGHGSSGNDLAKQA
jgi:hypothetical protein